MSEQPGDESTLAVFLRRLTCAAVVLAGLAFTAASAPGQTAENADAVYNGWLKAYLIRSGRQTYFCNTLTDRTRAFMWGQAYMIAGVEDAYERNNAPDRKQLVTELLNTFIENEIAHDKNKDLAWDTWNDDLQWAIIALIRGYQITGNTLYRDAAVKNWNVVYNRGWDATFGGGIWEKMDNVPNGGKGCLSNYPQIMSGCMIYQATKNADILAKCKAVYDWGRPHLFDPASGRLYEDWGPAGRNDKSDDNLYTSGLFINAANALYQITRTPGYLNDARLAASHQIKRYPVLTQDHPANGGFGADQFVRALSLLGRQNNLWGTYQPYLQIQCTHAWNNRRKDYNFTANDWSVPTTSTGDLRAMEVEGSVVLQAVTQLTPSAVTFSVFDSSH